MICYDLKWLEMTLEKNVVFFCFTLYLVWQFLNHPVTNLSTLFAPWLPWTKSIAIVAIFPWFLVACTRLYNLLCPSVGRLVGRSVGHTLLFFMISFLWPHCSCLNGLVTSNMAPACLPARDFRSRVSGLVFSIFVLELSSTLVWIFFSRLNV